MHENTCSAQTISSLAFILSVNYRSLRPQTWALLIITGLSLVPVCLGYALFPTLMVWSMVGLIWEDTKKAQCINPYPWHFSIHMLWKNAWVSFFVLYLFWMTHPFWEK